MHELAIATYLLDSILEIATDNALSTVQSVTLEVGAMKLVEPVAMQTAFEAVTLGTLCEGAVLNLEITQPECHCQSCGTRYTADVDNYTCPSCDDVSPVFERGMDLMLTRIEGH